MTVRTIAYLKERFEAGDRPTQQDFWDLFETMLTLETWPNPLPASSAELLTNIPIPDPLPAVSGEFLTNINRSDWIAIDAAPTYATSTSFVVPGDYTGPSYFVVGRRIRIALNPSGYYFGTVTAAVFSAGTTTVTVDETIPTSALASVDVNMLVDSDIVITSLKPGSGAALAVYRKSADGLAVEPWAVPAASDTVSGLVELATPAEVQALTDATRAVTPAGLAAAAAVLATANRLMLRDAAGRAQVVDPSAAADIATKNYTDGAVNTHAALTAPHSATSAATASRLMLRDGAGRAQVVDPSAAADIATKSYVDTAVAAVVPTGSKVVFRQAAAPTGWTQDTTLNDRVLRVVSGAGGGSGGNWVVSGLTVAAYTLTINDIPAHGHPYRQKTNIEGGTGNDNSGVLLTDTGLSQETHAAYAGAPSNVDGQAIGGTGGGGAHSHGISHNGTWRPAYADVIVCSKN